MGLHAGKVVMFLLRLVTDRHMKIAAALLVGEITIHTEKADEMLLHYAHM